MSLSIIDAQTYNQGKIGAIVEIGVGCDEHDLNDIEKSDLYVFEKEILFQVAVASPKYLSIADIPNDIIQNFEYNVSEHLRKNYFSCNNHTDKAELHIQKQISRGVESIRNESYKETCLLSQPWIKNKSKNIQNLIEEKSFFIGKTIKIIRFERYELKKESYNIPLRLGITIKN